MKKKGTVIRSVFRRIFPVSPQKPIYGQLCLYRQAKKFKHDMHYALEFGIVLAGRLRRQASDITMDLNPGCVWFCDMWETHGYRVLKAPCSVVTIWIEPEFLKNLHFAEAPGYNWMLPFIAPAGKRPQTHPKQRRRLISIGRQFENLFTQKDERAQIKLQLLCMQTLFMLTEDWKAPARMPPAPAMQAYARIKPAIDLVFRNRNFVTINEAAKTCFMSRNSFSMLFKQLMGITFSSFALRHRLNGAAERLFLTKDLIKTIARTWGFSDESHFRSLFQKHYNCSPRAYRIRYRIQT